MTQSGSFSNQRGGVGKTTSSINLGSALAGAERAGLIVDMDGPLPEGYTAVRLAVAPAGAGIAGVAINAAAYWGVLPVEVREWASGHGCGPEVTDPVIYIVAQDAAVPADGAVFLLLVEVVAESAATAPPTRAGTWSTRWMSRSGGGCACRSSLPAPPGSWNRSRVTGPRWTGCWVRRASPQEPGNRPHRGAGRSAVGGTAPA